MRKDLGNISEVWWGFLLYFHLPFAPLVEEEAKIHPMHYGRRHNVKDVENRSRNGFAELD